MTPPASEAALAAELAAAFAEDRAPRFERGEASLWARLIRDAIGAGRIDIGEHGLRHLRQRFPTFTFARRLGAVLERLPLAGAMLPFTDDPARDVQVVARPGADTVLLAFCGAAHDLGLPLGIMHRWFGRLDASLIYLRDFDLRRFLDGVRSLGTDRAATLAALRGLAASLGARRIVCFGASAGGFAAAHYGLDLGADAVWCTGGAFNLLPAFNAYTPLEARMRQWQAERPHTLLDLRELYAAAIRLPRLRIVFGADYWDDRIHAEHMAALPCVTLQPLAGFAEHNIVPELIVRGGLDAALQWLIAPDRAPDPDPPPAAPPRPPLTKIVPHAFAPAEGPSTPPAADAAGVLRLATPAPPWAYAATFPLRQAGLRGPLAVRITLRTAGAPVGVGLLNADGSDFEDRTILAPAERAETVLLCIDNPVTSAGLVVQSAAAGGPASVEITDLALLLPQFAPQATLLRDAFVPPRSRSWRRRLPWRVVTPATAWGYGAVLRPRDAGLRGPLRLSIEARVSGGKLGVGLLDDAGAFAVRSWLAPAAGPTRLLLDLADRVAVCGLVLQTWAEAVPSRVEIISLAVLLPE